MINPPIKVCALIPARLQASRFPGKLLMPLGNRSILQTVYDQVKKCKTIHRVAVVADHDDIIQHVHSWGGEAFLSQKEHNSGTDRIAETAGHLEGYDFLVNVQGDEPFIQPGDIDELVKTCCERSANIGTLVTPVTDQKTYSNINAVKVVLDNNGHALYFSRAMVPIWRDHPGQIPHHSVFRHIGLYVFKRECLMRITQWPESPLESLEKLEQLRWLQGGEKIITCKIAESAIGIDTPEDYEMALRKLSLE